VLVPVPVSFPVRVLQPLGLLVPWPVRVVARDQLVWFQVLVLRGLVLERACHSIWHLGLQILRASAFPPNGVSWRG